MEGLSPTRQPRFDLTACASTASERGAAITQDFLQKRKSGKRVLKIPLWWRHSVLPSLPWVVCFLSFFSHSHTGEKKAWRARCEIGDGRG